MAKRFTSTDKWEDLFFSNLTNKQKLIWIYLLDKCDNSGVWEKNFKVASFFIGETVTENECLEFLNDKVVEINGNKWFIPNFITFQYGELSGSVNPHKPVIEKLSKLGVYKNGEIKGINTPKQLLGRVKDKDKDKVKDKDKESGIFPDSLNTDVFKEAWANWESHRTEIRHKLTPSTITKQLEFLSKQPDPVACINRSIQNGWQGLFEENGKPRKTGNRTDCGGIQPTMDKKYKTANI